MAIAFASLSVELRKILTDNARFSRTNICLPRPLSQIPTLEIAISFPRPATINLTPAATQCPRPHLHPLLKPGLNHRSAVDATTHLPTPPSLIHQPYLLQNPALPAAALRPPTTRTIPTNNPHGRPLDLGELGQWQNRVNLLTRRLLNLRARLSLRRDRFRGRRTREMLSRLMIRVCGY